MTNTPKNKMPPPSVGNKPKKKWNIRLPKLTWGKTLGGGYVLRFGNNMPFVLWLTLIAMVYIYNGHIAERQARKLDKLQEDLKELKSEYMTVNAELSVYRKQTALKTLVDSIGLRPLDKPPYKLPVRD